MRAAGDGRVGLPRRYALFSSWRGQSKNQLREERKDERTSYTFRFTNATTAEERAAHPSQI